MLQGQAVFHMAPQQVPHGISPWNKTGKSPGFLRFQICNFGKKRDHFFPRGRIERFHRLRPGMKGFRSQPIRKNHLMRFQQEVKIVDWPGMGGTFHPRMPQQMPGRNKNFPFAKHTARNTGGNQDTMLR